MVLPHFLPWRDLCSVSYTHLDVYKRQLLGRTANEVVDTSAGNSEVARVKVVFGERTAADLPNVRVTRRRQFVKPVVTAEHKSRGSSKPEKISEKRRTRDVGDSCRRGLWSHWIAQRAKIVEDGLDAEF